MPHDRPVTIIGELGSIRTDLMPNAPALQPVRAGNAACKIICPRQRVNRVRELASLI
jgi:hypothetical protein